jgi:hypothetical protein
VQAATVHDPSDAMLNAVEAVKSPKLLPWLSTPVAV